MDKVGSSGAKAGMMELSLSVRFPILYRSQREAGINRTIPQLDASNCPCHKEVSVKKAEFRLGQTDQKELGSIEGGTEKTIWRRVTTEFHMQPPGEFGYRMEVVVD